MTVRLIPHQQSARWSIIGGDGRSRSIFSSVAYSLNYTVLLISPLYIYPSRLSVTPSNTLIALSFIQVITEALLEK